MRTLYQVDFEAKKLIKKIEIDEVGGLFRVGDDWEFCPLQYAIDEVLEMYEELGAEAYLVGA